MSSGWDLSDAVSTVHALWESDLATSARLARLCGSTNHLTMLRDWFLNDRYEAERLGNYSDRWRIQRADDVVPIAARALAQLLDVAVIRPGTDPYLDLYVEVPEQGRLTRSWHRQLHDLPLPAAKTELLWTSGDVDLRIKIDRVQFYVEEKRAVGYGHLMYPWSRASSATVVASYGFQPPRPRKRATR